jgi:hypothetical protein
LRILCNINLWHIVYHPGGEKKISTGLLTALHQKGAGIMIPALSGTGEAASAKEDIMDKSMALHTQARAELWLGKTMLGEWVKDCVWSQTG